MSSVTLAISRIISSFLVVPSCLLAGSWVFQVNQEFLDMELMPLLVFCRDILLKYHEKSDFLDAVLGKILKTHKLKS